MDEETQDDKKKLIEKIEKKRQVLQEIEEVKYLTTFIFSIIVSLSTF